MGLVPLIELACFEITERTLIGVFQRGEDRQDTPYPDRVNSNDYEAVTRVTGREIACPS